MAAGSSCCSAARPSSSNSSRSLSRQRRAASDEFSIIAFSVTAISRRKSSRDFIKDQPHSNAAAHEVTRSWLGFQPSSPGDDTMPKLTAAAQKRLDAAHPLLIKLFAACLADPACPAFTVLDSQRGRQAQEEAFNKGNSKAHFGQSAHNWTPALALDVVPSPIDWDDLPRFKALGKFVTAKAKALGIPVGWGGTWPRFKDYPHYEVTPWREFAKKAKLFGA